MSSRKVVSSISWTLQDVVVKLREANEWEQEDLAEAAEVSVSTIRRLEQGDQKITTRNMEKIATAFGFKNPFALHNLIPSNDPVVSAPAAPPNPTYEPALAIIIERWPDLLETTKESVIGLVEHDGGRSRGGSPPSGATMPETPAPAARTLPPHRGRRL